MSGKPQRHRRDLGLQIASCSPSAGDLTASERDSPLARRIPPRCGIDRGRVTGIRVSETTLVIAACLGFVASLLACVAARRFALRRSLLDRPNERSLHQVPVPRLGGAAITLTTLTVMAAFALRFGVERDLGIWLLAAVPVAVLGLVDDLRPLPAFIRLVVQIVICLVFCLALPLPNQLLLTPSLAVALPSWLSVSLGTLWLVALLNIYNFMDGMDGLAASQAVGAGLSFTLATYVASSTDLSLLSITLMGTAAGFFVHNAPPAKLFMGDVGSTFLGFGFAALTLIGLQRPTPIALSPAVFCLAPFLCDGSFTLLRRALRGEKVWQAHRTHLYQRAVTTGLQHHDVLVPYCAWVGLGAAGAALEVQTHGQRTLSIGITLLLCFAAVWLWVARREQAQSLQCADVDAAIEPKRDGLPNGGRGMA